MPQPSKIPPHGVKKQQLGLGVLGAHCYFRLRLSKLSRLAKRCLTLSAALLALCAWLCLITVMNVAPLQQNAQLEKGTTAAAVVKEDANFFIRSGELFDNRGSYPGFPHAPNGYLSPIDMRFKREKIGGNKEEKAQLMNVVIEERNQKGNRKAITNAGPTIAKGIITHRKEKFKLSNIDYDIKSSGVGSRLIQGFKVTEPRELEASFPRSKENSEIWSRLRSDKNRNDNDVTSYSRRLSSPSPYPTITTFQNQAPVPLFPFQHRSGRRREIDNGPITITRIRSSRQAPRNPLPNLAPEKEVDNGGNDIPKHSCLKHVMLDKKIRDSSDLVYNDISFQTSPTHLDNKNSQTSAPLQSEKLSARGLEELKKSINTRWLSGESEKQLNRQSNFYDDRKGTNGINRLSLSNGSYKNAQKIEANTVDTYSGLQRRVLELHNSHSQTIPLVGSGSNLPTEGERIGAERVTSQKPGIPGDNEVTVSSFRPISFHSTTSVRKIRGTAEFGGKRRATSGVKSGIKYPNHSTTRRRQNYKGVQGIRDGPSPQGSQPTVVRFHATSSRTRSNLTLGENSGNCTNVHCPRRETDKTVDLVYNGNFTGKQESAKSPARYLQFALIHNKTQLEKNLKQSFRDYKSLNMWNTTYKETGVLHNDGFDVYSYNVTASNAIPLDRNIPDTRPPGCQMLSAYSLTNHLPKATVVICFHNEALSVLLRTVLSVLNRTPPNLLDKIVLVNDASTLGDLSRGLSSKLFHMEKVVISNTERREGLVRARLLGASMARSEVVVFLDAHCECNVGWLEPLLYSLKQDPHKVVSPYIDTIRAESLEYRQSPPRLQGGFNWRLEFSWRAATTVGLETDPIRTPIISGGLFAVTKDFFLKMGGYDPQLNIWGGENFELSFKTWMCGGGLEILPCSRVGHVFRASLPYSFTPGPSDSSNVREDTVLTNLARVATVWMDQYADIFFAAVNFPSHLEVGDIHERAKLREKLHCKSFDWYLQQTFPELQIVSNDTLFHGQVKNSGSLMCLDVISSPSAGFSLGLTACHGGINQTFHLTADHRLRRGEACVTPGVNKTLSLAPCLSPATWSYQNGTLQMDHTDLCLTSVDNELARLLPCRKATLDDEANIANETHSEPNIRANSTGSYIRDRGLLSTSKLETFRNDDAFQHWKFDYSFNWKRKRRKG